MGDAVSSRRSSALRSESLSGYLGLGVFVLALSVYLLALRTNFGYDGQMMYRVTESLVLRHSFRVVDPVWHANEPYTYFGLAVSLLMVPIYALGQLVQHDGSRFIVLYEPLVTALTVLGLYALARDLGATHVRSLAVSLAYAFGSLAWHYSTTIFAEPLIAAAMTGALLWLRKYGRDGQTRWLVLAGSATGLSLLARWDSALLVVLPFSLYALVLVWRRTAMVWHRLAALALYALPTVVVLAVNLWYDWLRYGDPLNLGPRAQYGGVFSTPVLTGLYGLLLSPGVGLFVYVPLVALATVAFPRFWQRWRREAVLILLLLGLRLALYAQWSSWDGREWGPRFLVPVLPLLMLVLVAYPNGLRWRMPWIVLGGVGVAIEVLGHIVPFDTIVWPTTAPLIVSTFHLQDAVGSSCLCSRAVDQAAATVMDFNPRFAPLVRQVVLLLHGSIDPTWQSMWPVLTALLLLAASGAAFLWRVASRLDHARGVMQPPGTPRWSGAAA
jgi:hypothetical protein